MTDLDEFDGVLVVFCLLDEADGLGGGGREGIADFPTKTTPSVYSFVILLFANFSFISSAIFFFPLLLLEGLLFQP